MGINFKLFDLISWTNKALMLLIWFNNGQLKFLMQFNVILSTVDSGNFKIVSFQKNVFLTRKVNPSPGGKQSHLDGSPYWLSAETSQGRVRF